MTENLVDAKRALLAERDTSRAIHLLEAHTAALDGSPATTPLRHELLELQALAYQRAERYEHAAKTFLLTGNHYLAGYSHLLAGNLDTAATLWKNLLALRENHWCLHLQGMVVSSLATIPTFLQIRNHLEADIVNLYAAGQATFAGNLVRYTEFLAGLNLETYKYVGRSLLQAGHLQEAGPYLIKAQKTLPNDAEAYFHLGQYYYALHQEEPARLMLQQCLLISPAYTPARDLLATLSSSPGK